MHGYDVITRRCVFRNIDRRERCSVGRMSSSKEHKSAQCGSSKVLQKASSMTMDCEAQPQPFYLVQLAGR
jgi:hypothetical protein